jgi:small conductance mechanosensitive channel
MSIYLALAWRVFAALLIVGLGVLGVKALAAPLRRLLERGRMDASLASFLVNSAQTALLVIVIIETLGQLGVETTSLLTVLGAAGVAIALSLQGSLANFAAGLLILSFRVVRVGDLIEVVDVRGRVTDLLPFHVVVVTADCQRVTVPNSTLTGSPVRNYSAQPGRRAEWRLPVPASVDLAAIKESLVARLRTDRRILAEPPPRVLVQSWSATELTLAVQGWTKAEDWPTVQEELLEALGDTLQGPQEKRSSTTDSQVPPGPL